MNYSIDEARAICAQLAKVSLKSLGIDESEKAYLAEVDDRDVDNLHNGLNIWLSLYTDVCGVDSSILKGYISQMNIVSVILEAKTLRVEFIKSGFDYSIFKVGTPWYIFQRTTRGIVRPEDVIRVLGFPKRLYFCKANLEETCFKKITELNKFYSAYKVADIPGYDFGEWHFHPLTINRTTDPSGLHATLFHKNMWNCDLKPHVSYHDHTKQVILALVRKYVKELIGDKIPELNDFTLPPNSTYEHKKSDSTYLQKYLTVSKQKEFIQKFLDLPDDYFADTGRTEHIKYMGRLLSVPKDVGAYRTVFPEEVSRQVIGYAYVRAMKEILKKSPYTMNYESIAKELDVYEEQFADLYKFGKIDLNCQERNQIAARIGSVCNLIATVDWSQASDTNSVELSRAILPKAHFEFLNAIRAKWMQIGNRKIKSNIMFTMGFSATFLIESVIFTAIGRAAVALSWNFAPEADRKFFRNINRALASVFSYGDDLIMPSFAMGALEMIARHLGLKINVDKSYSDSPYRESCGKEYFNGIDITTEYFPRGTSSTRLAELIGLQHKLYMYPTVNAFIIEKCGTYRRHLTQNFIGSPYMDIWGYQSPLVSYRSPYASNSGQIIADEGVVRYSQTKDGVYTTEFGDIWIYWISLLGERAYVLSPIEDWVTNKRYRIQSINKSNLIGQALHHVRVVPDCVQNVDQEEYCQVTVPSVEYTNSHKSDLALDSLERLAYVMSLVEMSRRPSMNSDEYLEFMIDRDNSEPKLDPYVSESGIIDHRQLRKSLSEKSSIKLIRKIVMK
jgi:hypothetical protein